MCQWRKAIAMPIHLKESKSATPDEFQANRAQTEKLNCANEAPASAAVEKTFPF
jgi:hypothetical protein